MGARTRLREALEQQFHLCSIEATPGILHCKLKVHLLTVAPIRTKGLIDSLGSRGEEADTWCFAGGRAVFGSGQNDFDGPAGFRCGELDGVRREIDQHLVEELANH